MESTSSRHSPEQPNAADLQADLSLVEHSTVGSDFVRDSLAVINPLTSLTLLCLAGHQLFIPSR